MRTINSIPGSLPGYDTHALREQIIAMLSAVPGLLYSVRIAADGSLSMPFATPAIDDLFGVSAVSFESILRNFGETGDFVHPEDMSRLHGSLFEARTNLMPWRQEFRIRHPKKGERWIEASANPLPEPDGSILWRGYVQDITDRKIVDEALHYKNELLFAQQEASIDGILVVNTDFSINSMNSRFAEMWGLPQDLIDRKDHKAILEFSTPQFANPDLFAAGVKHLYQDPSGRSHDELPLKDGRIIERHSAPLYGSAGQLRGRLWTFRDITAPRKAQQALLDSKALLSEMGRMAKIGGWEIDVASGTTTWTDEVTEIHALDVSTPINVEKAMDFYVGKSRLILAEAFKASSEKGESFDLELEFEAADGVRKWLRVIGSPEIRDSRVFRVRGSVQDITDQKKASIALQESEALFSTVFRVSPIAINIFRMSDGRSILANDQFLSLIGFSREEVLGHTAAELGLFADPLARPPLMKQLGEAKGASFTESKIRSKSGELRDALASLNVITLNGEAAAIVVATDITDRKQAEAKMKTLQEELTQAQKMEAIGRLAGGVAHDFNNLLQVINAYSKRIADDYASDPVLSRYGRSIHQAGEIAANLTRQLLAFSRRAPAEPRKVELDAVLAGMEDMMPALLGEGVDLQLSLKSAGGFIMVDPSQIEQVVLNLAVNARDAMPNGGVLKLSTSLGHREVTLDNPADLGSINLSVSDSGHGMDLETQKRVFEPFFTTKQLGRGTGLGLSMVYGIVQQCGGVIEVESQPGIGTEFRLSFPLVEMPELQEAHVETAKSDHGLERILVVDDDPDLRDLYQDALRERGYHVLTAANGREALSLIEAGEEIFDLVVSDSKMPIMGGIELFEALRRIRPRLKLLLMSGNVGDGLSNSETVSDVDLLSKPFSIEAFSAKVRQLMD